MDVKISQNKSHVYIETIPGSGLIARDSDALELVAACGEQETNLLMIHAENLSEDFFHLSTGVAGAILLKFSNYYLKVAAVLTPQQASQGKFHEMVLETNRGNEFRVFFERELAEKWLVE